MGNISHSKFWAVFRWVLFYLHVFIQHILCLLFGLLNFLFQHWILSCLLLFIPKLLTIFFKNVLLIWSFSLFLSDILLYRRLREFGIHVIITLIFSFWIFELLSKNILKTLTVLWRLASIGLFRISWGIAWLSIIIIFIVIEISIHGIEHKFFNIVSIHLHLLTGQYLHLEWVLSLFVTRFLLHLNTNWARLLKRFIVKIVFVSFIKRPVWIKPIFPFVWFELKTALMISIWFRSHSIQF